MTSRAAHLDDIRARLADKIPAVGARVWRSRIKTIDPAKHLPCICLYAPDEKSGQPEAAGAQPMFSPVYTFAIEIRTAETDGFDLQAGAIAEAVKALLYSDPAWLRRFKPYPHWDIRQFLDRRGESSFCGEVITITAQSRRPLDFRPPAPVVSGLTLAVDADGDANPEIIVNMERPLE